MMPNVMMMPICYDVPIKFKFENYPVVYYLST